VKKNSFSDIAEFIFRNHAMARAADARSCAAAAGLALNWVAFALYTIFVLGYVVVYLYIFEPALEPEPKQPGVNGYPPEAAIGFHLHATTGSLYFLLGGLQFLNPLRQRFPRVHRALGILYYAMVFVTAIGIVWLTAVRPKAGPFTVTLIIFALPLWLWINVLSITAIVVFRDVELHRTLNIFGLAFATSIIFMRPGVFVFTTLVPGWENSADLALGLSEFLLFMASGSLALLYTHFAYTIPVRKRPRLHDSGRALMGASSGAASVKFLPASTESVTMLDGRTVHLCLKLRPRGLSTVEFLPGCHVALRFRGVTREYVLSCCLQDLCPSHSLPNSVSFTRSISTDTHRYRMIWCRPSRLSPPGRLARDGI
jgi:uncharacterized membrane protein